MENQLYVIWREPLPSIIGLIATVGLGIVVDLRLNAILQVFRRNPPAGMTPEDWETLLEWPETYGGAVHWLGLLERIGFFVALRMAATSFIGVWLVFKLGCYWAVWHGFLRGANRPPEVNETGFMVLQSRRANAMATVCCLGTIANLLVAFLGMLFYVLVIRLGR